MRQYIFEILAVSTAILLSPSCAKQKAEEALSNDEIVVVPSLEETKATMIAAGDLTANRIHLDGYLHGLETKHLDANILYEGGKWIFYTTDAYALKDVHYYWPQNSSLDILAYSPANLDKTNIEIKSSKQVKCTKLPMDYANQSGTNLNEFIVGYKADCKKDDGAVNITLNRPYAAVRFCIMEAVRSTLNYLEVTNLYSTGTYTSDASGKFTWGNFADVKDLHLAIGKAYPTEINNKTPLNNEYFLVIPQTLITDNIKLKFSYRSVGNTKDTITETSIGKALRSDTSAPVDAWEPGKKYNYYITLNGAANEVRMAVTVEPWKVEGSSETEVK